MTVMLETVENPTILSKYHAAAAIINETLADLVARSTDGANVFELCLLGDSLIADRCAKIYTKGKVQKGTAFPTCVSLNDFICHYSPSADTGLVMKKGDVVKIELGSHIDGYPVLLAHTLVVGGLEAADSDTADMIAAAHTAADVAYRLFQQGGNTHTLARAMEASIAAFHCRSIDGTISFQLDHNTLGGSKYIIVAPNNEQLKAAHPQALGKYDVFAIDVAVTKGNGSYAPLPGEKPWLYRKADKSTGTLKTKAGKLLLTTVNANYGQMAFHIRNLSEPHLGMSELISKQALQSYESLVEPAGQKVVRFMFTVILLSTGPSRITHWEPLPASLSPIKKIKDPELLKILSTDPRKKKSTSNID